MEIILLGAVVLCLILIFNFNRLVFSKNAVKNAFAQIDVQLKRRYDLIPNLVETTKSSMTYEQETLEKVIAARNQALSTIKSMGKNLNEENMSNLVKAESALNSAMKQFSVVMENYPDLKANSSMNQLMEELTSTESRIAFARQAYNDSVMYYNTNREVFPANLFAGILGFPAMTSFEIINVVEREPIKVKLT